jgi:hypothetical protein
MTILLNVSYFLALTCVGAFALLMALTPVLTTLPEEAVALGLVKAPERAKIAIYLLVTALWSGALIWLWIRHRGLVPAAIKPGCRSRLVLGQSMILVGHLTVLGIIFVELMRWLMILPVLVIVSCYVAGVLLTERSRQRGKPASE